MQTFFERDLPQLGVGIPAATLHRFWSMLAHYHGQVWNASEFGRAFGVSDHAVRRYLDILSATLVVRQLRPWAENLGKRVVKSPKVGQLSRVAYRTLRDFMRITCREPDLVPGVVACIQTHGSLVNWHPHLHLLVTDGAFRPDGTFLHLGYHEIKVLTEAFRRAVLREFVQLELLTEDDARSMLQWPHGGFHVDHSVRLEAEDACGILQLACYSARAPVSLERLQYQSRKQQVTLQSDKRAGPTAGTHVFPALEFLAMLLSHVPDTLERLVREYDAYSTRRRARWRRAGVLTDTRTLASVSPAADCVPPDWPTLRAIRQRWAELLKRIYEVDALRCRHCAGEMRIISFILDPEVVAAILRHLQRKGRDPRALPEHAALRVERVPP